MKMNKGKNFEKCWQDSCKDDGVCCIRLVDSNKFGFGGNTNTRFTPDNICDFICHYRDTMFLLELKHTQGSSISFNQPVMEKGDGTYMIKPKQIKRLMDYKDYENVIALDYLNEPMITDNSNKVFCTLVNNAVKVGLNKDFHAERYFENGRERSGFLRMALAIALKVRKIGNLKNLFITIKGYRQIRKKRL